MWHEEMTIKGILLLIEPEHMGSKYVSTTFLIFLHNDAMPHAQMLATYVL